MVKGTQLAKQKNKTEENLDASLSNLWIKKLKH